MKKKERKATGREKVFEERLPKFTLNTTVQSERGQLTSACHYVSMVAVT